ncbi:Lipoate-protein ligase A, N-terminal 30 percent [plant metagenome]|uniref:lipoate--protein ligase n=1 Tax=plant metagenome TaxID=1297885 RepID=A0A484TH97_9ZZZZ
MHAEYKVPGGKLVVADLEVVDGQMRNVRISGDFFLEPPEALDAINDALEGMPVEASETEIALAVQLALPDKAELFGFSSEAIAVTVGRALG